jgi:hypothetical protein
VQRKGPGQAMSTQYSQMKQMANKAEWNGLCTLALAVKADAQFKEAKNSTQTEGELRMSDGSRTADVREDEGGRLEE